MLAYFSVVSDGRTLRGVGHIPDGDNHELRGAGQIPDNSSKYPCLFLMHGLTRRSGERISTLKHGRIFSEHLHSLCVQMFFLYLL